MRQGGVRGVVADRGEGTGQDRSGARTGLAQQLRTREGVVLGALWLLAGALAARQAAAVLRIPSHERFVDLFAWIGENGVLRVRGSLYDGSAPFTGTPFAGLVLKPLTRAAEQGLGVAWTVGTMLLVAAVGVVAARALPGPVSRRTSLFAVPVALSLLALSIPVRNTFHLGQTSILPVLLVLVGWLLRGEDKTGQGRQAGGVLIGVAGALQPATLLFVPLLWLTGRRQAAFAGAGTFAACSVAAWAAMPADSWTYWVRHVVGAGLGDPADATANQSLHGALLRLGLRGPLEVTLLLVLVAGITWLAMRRAVRYARDGQLLLAAAVVGCAAVAVSPTAWQHQLLWVLLAVVGRVGRRKADRLVWPVFVTLVLTLDGDALVPKVAAFGFLGENAVLLAALLAACAVPFVSRGSPLWDSPASSGPLSRPNLMLELLLIRVGYWAYSYVRGHAPDSRTLAEGHGDQILGVEKFLHIDIEHTVNKLAVDTSWLRHLCDSYYTTFHFLVPIALLAWLYMRRTAHYRSARTALSFATLLGLVGFWLYPLAPPRLMPGLGYVDTAHGPQDPSKPDFGALTELSNQYAAMPSLHVGWSLWCAVVVFQMTKKHWARALGALYPLMTTFVVLATANHYLLDAAGGVLVVATGFAAQRWVARIRDRRETPGEQEPGSDAGSQVGPEPHAPAVSRAASGPSPRGPRSSGDRKEPAPQE
ncbi:bifunctional glycosyltransferase 87/phosphatase PAP2 family protein [Streptomyces iconiensis]|uniref:Bifunctional glycosyltransferase 87/phosphatase PAP2 family protein n=1 Tax=Streptomyces iconiensis TaxID=1384038 RepID=A0ABT6ZQ61_9ACTN|nr:bifunctional glycosyltransferase 87/phosphatase PAP2 family protein [Streptomyces iconiensis]MDJ1130663.1 bifunctional glycosyltransferase 87/phosphatase PAP2 family protein [Streptomyces iconiensis]